MARKKSAKKKSTKRDPERDLRNKRIALGSAMLVAAAAVFGGAAMGLGELDRKAAAIIAPTDTLSVEVNWPTDARGRHWLPSADQENIEKTLMNAVKGGTALTQSPLEEAGRSLMKTGWLEGVPTARWTSDGVVSVEGQWRAPLAAVRLGNREIVIDRMRHVLPLDYAIGQSNQYFFLGIDAPLPDVGEQWPGTDLENGIELLELLRDEGLLEQIVGFDLGDGAESGILKIITKRDATIVWGAGPGRELPGEKPAGVKIGRLKEFLKTTSLIDGGFGFLDIRGTDILVVRSER